MAEFIGSIFSYVFGSQSWLATLLISMFPIIELKGAIPVGMSTDFWGEHALTSMQAFWFSLLGSCLVVPIVALIFTPIIKWMKTTKIFKKLATAIENKVNKSSEKLSSSNKTTFLKMLGVFVFVAIPLPLTGVWTGTCIAVAIGLKVWQSVVSVVLGNIVAGLLVTFVCSIFPQFTTIIFLVVFAIVIVLLVVWIIKAFIQKDKGDTGTNISQ